jgi:predicted RNA-binding Zn-ribbon protein involved in translation (DUF1610 family)
MMKAALKPTHEARVDVPCPRCGETTAESVYRVWHSRELVCRACGALISLASEEVQREADRAERDWREHWGTIGWHFPGSG